jgi:hypothetical protein
MLLEGILYRRPVTNHLEIINPKRGVRLRPQAKVVRPIGCWLSPDAFLPLRAVMTFYECDFLFLSCTLQSHRTNICSKWPLLLGYSAPQTREVTTKSQLLPYHKTANQWHRCAPLKDVSSFDFRELILPSLAFVFKRSRQRPESKICSLKMVQLPDLNGSESLAFWQLPCQNWRFC